MRGEHQEAIPQAKEARLVVYKAGRAQTEEPNEEGPQDKPSVQTPEKKQILDQRQQDGQLQIQQKQTTQLIISRKEVEYRIELGLTRGTSTVVSKLREASTLLKKPEADAAFDICKKLDFHSIRSKLVEFHKNRRAEIEDPQKMDRVPSTCDLRDPDDIYDALRVTHGQTKIAKIYRAYGQMRLVSSVRRLTSVGESKKKYTEVLDELAHKKAGKVSKGERKSKMKSYKDEYQGGVKWRNVSHWFGGKAVVMVFVVAGQSCQTFF